MKNTKSQRSGAKVREVSDCKAFCKNFLVAGVNDAKNPRQYHLCIDKSKSHLPGYGLGVMMTFKAEDCNTKCPLFKDKRVKWGKGRGAIKL